MNSLVFSGLFLCLFMVIAPLRAQYTPPEEPIAPENEYMAVGESRDIPCPYGLNATFYEGLPIKFEGYRFLTEWRSKRSDMPLPSWNWYRAVPTPDVTSVDGKVRWEDAEIQVHCWLYRAHYFQQRHYDHVAGVGRITCLTGGGGALAVWEDTYDPYVESGGAVLSSVCDDGESGGDGGGGGSGCTWVWVEIQISGDGQTWDTLWSGYACETQ